ncbi:hypothetical protein [Pedobacter sp. SYSU D00535]|uniref:hypothetical protein n=1 Tax=Pedobacter sp. SYSU D00535 TaxID=2810308 RepID=UPI001A97AC5B|nr:hypothetical protein [Pedobacter sp. SYSU D00535]
METNKLNYSIIQQYLEGKLSEKEMHELERQALDDPFLADALEGYSVSTSAAKHLSLLQRQLEERVAQQEENKNQFFFSWQRVSIAAAATLLFIAASILFWMKGTGSKENHSEQQNVEVKLSTFNNLKIVSSTGNAQPQRGWKDYQQYLNINLTEKAAAPSSQSIVVGVYLDRKGAIENVKLLSGPSSKRSDEAIRLIKEGPEWTASQLPTEVKLKLELK